MFIVNKPAGEVRSALILAHGAGAGMDSPFMETMSHLLAERGILVLRFEFPYMQQRRKTGSKRLPDRQPVLEAAWIQAIAEAKLTYPAVNHWYIGGKSLGGRIATLILAQADVCGCICLGYPFHPAGRPQKLRVNHLQTLKEPLLIAQGTRDKLGSQVEVVSYFLPQHIKWVWLEDGDHDLKPRVRSGFTHADHMARSADAITEFML